MTDCTGPFSVFQPGMLAGAELPLIQRGATLRGATPADGVGGATVAGKPVELVRGCIGSTPTYATLLAEARRLVEQEGVDAIVGPISVNQAAALRQYAERQPGVVFSIALSDEQTTTLRNPLPNVFRFVPDYAQWMAGLGAYAYHNLGWRTAVTLGEDDPFGWEQNAGFVAEFCALGGRVVRRLWAPFFATDLSPYVRSTLATGADGVFLSGGSQNTASFFRAYAKATHDTSRRVVAGGAALLQLDPAALGVVSAWPVPSGARTKAWSRYARAFATTFPTVQGTGIFDVPYYDAMEAVLEGLEQVDGDLTNGEQRLKQALATLELDAPNGRTTLDANHAAVVDNYLARVGKNAAGQLVNHRYATVPATEETFGGYFRSTILAPSRTTPDCVERTPPPWARR